MTVLESYALKLINDNTLFYCIFSKRVNKIYSSKLYTITFKDYKFPNHINCELILNSFLPYVLDYYKLPSIKAKKIYENYHSNIIPNIKEYDDLSHIKRRNDRKLNINNDDKLGVNDDLHLEYDDKLNYEVNKCIIC